MSAATLDEVCERFRPIAAELHARFRSDHEPHERPVVFFGEQETIARFAPVGDERWQAVTMSAETAASVADDVGAGPNVREMLALLMADECEAIGVVGVVSRGDLVELRCEVVSFDAPRALGDA